MGMALFMVFPAQAEEPQAAAVETVAPSLELLEFLGSFEMAEGKFFDPLLLAEDLPAKPHKKSRGESR